MVDTKSYFDKIEKGLALNAELQRRVLDDLKNSVNDYLESNPEATAKEICREFGTPEEIISANQAKLAEIKVKKAKRAKAWIISFFAVAAILLCCVMTYYLIDGFKASRAYGEEGEAVVEHNQTIPETAV